MSRSLSAVLILLLIPGAAFASTVRTDRTLVISEPITDNAYLAGTDITVVAPASGDVLAAGGTLTISAPVAGDLFLTGGTIDVNQPVTGDVRAAGGRILIENEIAGDLMAAGGSILVTGAASSTRLAGGVVDMRSGARGPVVIYGADVSLAGEYDGDVIIAASDRLTIAEGTVIRGTLRYNSPQQVALPASATVAGGVEYTGSASYLPTNEEAERFALAGAGVLLVVRAIAALIAAGLLAGLFPAFTAQVVERTLSRSPRRFILLALLGFAIVVATPVLILLLLLSFVGMAVAVVLLLAYILLLILGYLFAGILAGAALSRGILKNPGTSWRAAVLGMLALYLIGIIPTVGPLVTLVLAACAVGALSAIAYQFAFSRESDPDLSL